MSTSSTPRASSSSRNAKRSTTNLSNLRLAPLSTRFAGETTLPRSAPRSPYDEAAELVYARHHPTYLQGRSAPSTPGILSRSSSRRHLGGGLSRRGSLYDDAPEYPAKDTPERLPGHVEGATLPKASSEATLSHPSRLSGPGLPLHRRRHPLPPRSKTGGSTTPRAKTKSRRQSNEDWLSRASAATATLLQESKGQTWLSSHNSSVSLAAESEDEDEGYEELAALSASTLNLSLASPEQRHAGGQHKWGSRFGSRSASRRTSRRGSFSRTPGTQTEGMEGYFSTSSPILTTTSELAEESSSSSPASSDIDESELAALARNQSMGFSGIVDKIMSFSIFGTAETSEESGGETATEEEGQQARRVRVQAPLPAPPVEKEEGERVGVWEDAAWLISVAGRALT